MNLTINTEQLRNTLRTVQGSIDRRTTLPILSHVLLRASEDQLSLTTTNLDTTIRCTAPCGVVEPGEITVPHELLLNLVKAVQQKEITLNSKEPKSCMEIAAESHVTLNGLPSDEFPRVQKLKDFCSFEISQLALKHLLTQTAFCMSTDESRYVLNGVWMKLEDKELVVVGTDGRRISIIKSEVKGQNCEMILPARTVHQLIPLLTGETTIAIEVESREWIRFTIGSVILVSKLIDGNYPNYKQVIPDDPRIRVNVSRSDLLQAVTRAKTLITDKDSTVRLHFTKNNLAISMNSSLGQVRENIPINYSEHESRIALSSHYFQEVLANAPESEVSLEVKSELDPIVIKSGSLLHVLMPMRFG